MSDYHIRKAAEGDRDRVIRLVSKMWSEDIAPRYERFYLSNPHGRALTWLAVETSTGETVGCTSIFPRRVIVDGRERTGSIGGDCYIEPRMRRRGIATALHRESLIGMREEGIDFMYGPPNPSNLHALVKAGSRVVTNFKRWVRPLAGRAVYRAAFARAPSRLEAQIAGLPLRVLDRLTRADVRGFTLEEVTAFGPEFDSLFERAASGHRVVCVRDRDYLQWRYLKSPGRRQVPFAVRHEGELVGFVSLETNGEQAAIVDMFALRDQRVTDATLQVVLDQVAATACSGLEVSCTPAGVLAPSLRRLGFIGRSDRGFQVAVRDHEAQSDTLLNPNAWYFMAADQDMDTFFSDLPD